MRALRWLQEPPSVAALSLFAAASLLAAMALTAPASLATAQLEKRSDRILLQGVSGTVWAGHSQTAFLRVQSRWYTLEDLQWQWLPLPLLAGELGLKIDFQHRGEHAAAVLHMGRGTGLSLKPASFSGLPIEYLNPALALPIALLGELVININELAWRDGLAAIDASIGWRNAGASYNKTDYRLGILAAALRMPAAGTLQAELSDSGGPLELAGQFNYADNRIQLDATLKPRQAIPDDLRGALSLLGQPLPNEDGWRLQFSGAFNLPWLRMAAPEPTATAAEATPAEG